MPKVSRRILRAESSRAEPRLRQVPAVSRALAILRLLGRSEKPMGVNQIARELSLIPSTCLHILRVLMAEELVAFDFDTKLYSLDVGVLTIARSALRPNSFSDLAQPVLRELTANFNVTACAIQVMSLEHVIVVAVTPATSSIRIHVDLGSRFPALSSAHGRCVAAFGGFRQSDVEARFRKLRWENGPRLDRWRTEVQKVQDTGYAVDAGNFVSGMTAVAAPVFGKKGRMTHGLALIGMSDQLEQIGLEKLGTRLAKHARELSQKMMKVEIYQPRPARTRNYNHAAGKWA